jgi:hypothetical protein
VSRSMGVQGIACWLDCKRVWLFEGNFSRIWKSLLGNLVIGVMVGAHL